jgi:hypothetical protein
MTLDSGVKAAASRRGLTPEEYLARQVNEKWCRACQAWRLRTDFKPSTSTHDQLRPLCIRHYTAPARAPHGRIVVYRRGCRCQQCRNANTQAQRTANAHRKANPAAADRAGHGKSTTYNNYGCRCPACKDAQVVKNAANRHARKERQSA